jgi:hypothetical protein
MHSHPLFKETAQCAVPQIAPEEKIRDLSGSEI